MCVCVSLSLSIYIYIHTYIRYTYIYIYIYIYNGVLHAPDPWQQDLQSHLRSARISWCLLFGVISGLCMFVYYCVIC